jgi:hypothetical protein
MPLDHDLEGRMLHPGQAPANALVPLCYVFTYHCVTHNRYIYSVLGQQSVPGHATPID